MRIIIRLKNNLCGIDHFILSCSVIGKNVCINFFENSVECSIRIEIKLDLIISYPVKGSFRVIRKNP